MIMRFLGILFVLLTSTIQVFAQTKDVTKLCAEQTGKAAYYADRFHGKPTSSGEPYNTKLFTAAHRKLAFGSKVLVTNLDNNKTVEVRINDRGPFSDVKIIDLSRVAAEQIDLIDAGIASVKIKVLSVGKNGERCNLAQPQAKENIPRKSYKVTEQALNYNIWGEKVNLEGHSIMIATHTRLESAIDAALEAYYKNFNQVFILADAPSKDKRVFRVLVGQGTESEILELGQQLLKKGFSNLFLVKHKKVNKI